MYMVTWLFHMNVRDRNGMSIIEYKEIKIENEILARRFIRGLRQDANISDVRLFHCIEMKI